MRKQVIFMRPFPLPTERPTGFIDEMLQRRISFINGIQGLGEDLDLGCLLCCVDGSSESRATASIITTLLPTLSAVEVIPLNGVIDRFPLVEYFERLLESNDTLIVVTNVTMCEDALEQVVKEVLRNYAWLPLTPAGIAFLYQEIPHYEESRAREVNIPDNEDAPTYIM